MTYLHKLTLAALMVLMVAVMGYFYGRQLSHEAALKAAVNAYQTRERINDETDKMDFIDLCLALGGVQHTCADSLLRLHTPTQNQ